MVILDWSILLRNTVYCVSYSIYELLVPGLELQPWAQYMPMYHGSSTLKEQVYPYLQEFEVTLRLGKLYNQVGVKGRLAEPFSRFYAMSSPNSISASECSWFLVSKILKTDLKPIYCLSYVSLAGKQGSRLNIQAQVSNKSFCPYGPCLSGGDRQRKNISHIFLHAAPDTKHGVCHFQLTKGQSLSCSSRSAFKLDWKSLARLWSLKKIWQSESQCSFFHQDWPVWVWEKMF